MIKQLSITDNMSINKTLAVR